MQHFDFLIVGAGFAGATLAHKLHKQGKKVLVVEKRNHIAGNCYDFYDDSGVLIHKYGPHYFRTNYDAVKEFLSQFTDWIPQEYRVRVSIKNKLYSFPINRTTLNEFFGLNLKTVEEAEAFLAAQRVKIAKPKNAEEQVLATAGKKIYEAFFKNYTKKQWGIDPKKLGPSVTARIPIRTDTNDHYTSAKFQALPKNGYTQLFEKMLTGIPVMLNTDYEDLKKYVEFDNVIYTGPIDTYFNYKFGKLPYRSLRFEFETYEKEFYQDWLQVNYPNEHRYTRIVEIKHITQQKTPFTTISKEFPTNEGEPYYPVPNPTNEKRYQKYLAESRKLPNVHFIGRLAQYQYLNMDEVVKSALDLFEQKFAAQ
jgi:UDP-galactopyranose mutase